MLSDSFLESLYLANLPAYLGPMGWYASLIYSTGNGIVHVFAHFKLWRGLVMSCPLHECADHVNVWILIGFFNLKRSNLGIKNGMWKREKMAKRYSFKKGTY